MVILEQQVEERSIDLISGVCTNTLKSPKTQVVGDCGTSIYIDLLYPGHENCEGT